MNPAMFRLTECNVARLQRICILRWRAFVQFERDRYPPLVSSYPSYMNLTCDEPLPSMAPWPTALCPELMFFYAVMVTVTRPGHDYRRSSADGHRVGKCYRQFHRGVGAVVYLRKVSLQIGGLRPLRPPHLDVRPDRRSRCLPRPVQGDIEVVTVTGPGREVCVLIRDDHRERAVYKRDRR